MISDARAISSYIFNKGRMFYSASQSPRALYKRFGMCSTTSVLLEDFREFLEDKDGDVIFQG